MPYPFERRLNAVRGYMELRLPGSIGNPDGVDEIVPIERTSLIAADK